MLSETQDRFDITSFALGLLFLFFRQPDLLVEVIAVTLDLFSRSNLITDTARHFGQQ